jgi:hypothetical protein
VPKVRIAADPRPRRKPALAPISVIARWFALDEGGLIAYAFELMGLNHARG